MVQQLPKPTCEPQLVRSLVEATFGAEQRKQLREAAGGQRRHPRAELRRQVGERDLRKLLHASNNTSIILACIP